MDKVVLRCIGPRRIDAATRIVGFFVYRMGMGLIFHDVVKLLTYDTTAAQSAHRNHAERLPR